jgi:4'-phosphopantetheinyl transferase
VNPDPGVVDVVWAHTRETADGASLLDQRERERLARLQRPTDRARYVAAHTLLRLVVADRWGVEPAAVEVTATCSRCREPHGRPVVIPSPGHQALYVTIAHADDRVVVAVTEVGPIGVDVEARAAARFAGFDAVALAEQERQTLAALPVDQQLTGRTQVWVRKEAVLKATGDGLSVDPRAVIVSPPAQPPRLLAWRDGAVAPSRVHLTDLAVGSGYAACLALLASHPARVRLRNGDALLARPAARPTPRVGAAGSATTA